jgi:hypothetical protein
MDTKFSSEDPKDSINARMIKMYLEGIWTGLIKLSLGPGLLLL